MSLVRGADIVVKADLGVHPFMLDRDLLDANPGSELGEGATAYDVVSCATLSMQWTWGAGDPLGPLTEVEGGRISISLKDLARLFDPSNAASAYYPYLHVGTQLRVDVDGQPGWTGTLEAWEWDTGEQVATLLGIDAIATLAALVLPSDTVIASGTSAAQATAVLDAVGWPASLRTFTGTSAVSRTDVPVAGQAMEALHAIRFAELGQLWGMRSGSIAFRARGTTASSTPTTIINCGGVGLVGLASTFNRGRVRNVVRIDDAVSPLVSVVAASATIHGPRTVRASADDLDFSPLGSRPAMYQAWADTVTGALAQPRPASRLGTLVPVGAAQVDVILRAEWGDVWRLVDTGTSPGIDRTVRVLGERVSITPSTIEVDAVTEDLTGDAVAATAPGAPVLVSATPAAGQVTLAWTAPTSDGGSAIIDYTVTASPGGLTCTTTGLTCSISGLTNGTLYTFTVKARNAIGAGPASNALTATPTAPIYVERIQARPAGGGTAATSGNFTHGAGFTPTMDGFITHIATYHYAPSSHTAGQLHPLSIWTTAGVKVAHVDFVCPGNGLFADIERPTPSDMDPRAPEPRATQWYEIPLATKFPIVSGTTYRVTCSAPAYTYFSTAPPASLAPHINVSGAGYFIAGSDVFPTTAQPSNYYPIDVVAEFSY